MQQQQLMHAEPATDANTSTILPSPPALTSSEQQQQQQQQVYALSTSSGTTSTTGKHKRAHDLAWMVVAGME
jgi:hypothetical protein